MTPEQQSQQERTEQATPKRLSEARKKGQAAKSMDLTAAVGFLGMVAVLAFTAERLINVSLNYIVVSLSDLSAVTELNYSFSHLLVHGVSIFAAMVWPLLAAALVLGAIANIMQVGFLWSGDPLKPEFSRLDPLEGLGRMMSTRALFDLAKALGKLLAVGFAAYLGLRGEMQNLLLAGYSEGAGSFALVGRVLYGVALRVGVTYLVIGVIDFLYQRHEFRQNMMMTRQEVKEEHKQMEGDPQVKARQRERQRLLATGRMFAAIPTATVVVTNPTHYAVALRYEREGSSGAPQVVAKGCDYLAQRIKARAAECGIPLVENSTLARSLYQQSEVGQEIPVALYRAVAEILAEIFSRQRRLI
ncbi:MAG: flagellar biosynthesis protein FlhB [Selenomonadales bacterium]|jgi:flagellar biosynthetic protein FlhB|nr:flagellar biosynthesis protein FlhB [Selenomonadales bacterium]